MRAFATLNRPYHVIPFTQAPQQTNVPCRRTTAWVLTCNLLSSSTTVSRGPSLARSVKEQKASQSLPALQAPVLNRGGHCPRGNRPEVSLRSEWFSTSAGPVAGRSLKRVKTIDLRPGTRCRSPIPPSSSTRVPRRQQLCLPSWAPCWSQLRHSTPPWTFGQGWPHASGWCYVFQD